MLLAKLSAGDLNSQEAVYHSDCLVTLYSKAIKVERKNPSPAMNLLKATKIIHQDILAKMTKFNGMFESTSHQHVAPESLRCF